MTHTIDDRIRFLFSWNKMQPTGSSYRNSGLHLGVIFRRRVRLKTCGKFNRTVKIRLWNVEFEWKDTFECAVVSYEYIVRGNCVFCTKLIFEGWLLPFINSCEFNLNVWEFWNFVSSILKTFYQTCWNRWNSKINQVWFCQMIVVIWWHLRRIFKNFRIKQKIIFKTFLSRVIS